MLYSQFTKFGCCTMRFICVDPRLDEVFLEVFVDRFIWSRRGGNGQDPVLRTSFPFIDVWAAYMGEGMGDLLPWIHHDQVCGVYELVKTEFVKEVIGLLSVSVEDGGFFPLEWFFIYSDGIWALQESRGRSRWWRQRGWTSERSL